MASSAKQKDYYQRFADEIIERIGEGTAPWQKPWQPGERALPHNLASGRAYTAGNSMYLAVAADRRGFADTRWATYRQIQALGGHVRKGQRGEQIVFFARNARSLLRDRDGKPKLDGDGQKMYRTVRLPRPVWRTFTVFNAEQTAGLKLDRPSASRPGWLPHRVAEAVIEQAGVAIRHQRGDRAFYHLTRDRIVLPERGQFPSANHYYQTALHELGHATGHPNRLDRETLQKGIDAGFGSPDYAREELRAEIGAMMTGDRLGAGHDPARGAAYVEGWIRALEQDPREIHRAAADAQRISNYLTEPARERIADIEKSLDGPDPRIRPEHDRERDAPVRAPDPQPPTRTPAAAGADRSR